MTTLPLDHNWYYGSSGTSAALTPSYGGEKIPSQVWYLSDVGTLRCVPAVWYARFSTAVCVAVRLCPTLSSSDFDFLTPLAPKKLVSVSMKIRALFVVCRNGSRSLAHTDIELKSGDTVVMDLNMDKGELKFIINGLSFPFVETRQNVLHTCPGRCFSVRDCLWLACAPNKTRAKPSEKLRNDEQVGAPRVTRCVRCAGVPLGETITNVTGEVFPAVFTAGDVGDSITLVSFSQER